MLRVSSPASTGVTVGFFDVAQAQTENAAMSPIVSTSGSGSRSVPSAVIHVGSARFLKVRAFAIDLRGRRSFRKTSIVRRRAEDPRTRESLPKPSEGGEA
jgi:hypothetical protein